MIFYLCHQIYWMSFFFKLSFLYAEESGFVFLLLPFAVVILASLCTCMQDAFNQSIKKELLTALVGWFSLLKIHYYLYVYIQAHKNGFDRPSSRTNQRVYWKSREVKAVPNTLPKAWNPEEKRKMGSRNNTYSCIYKNKEKQETE